MFTRANIQTTVDNLIHLIQWWGCSEALSGAGLLSPVGTAVLPFFNAQYGNNDRKRGLLLFVLVNVGATVFFAGAKWIVHKLSIEDKDKSKLANARAELESKRAKWVVSLGGKRGITVKNALSESEDEPETPYKTDDAEPRGEFKSMYGDDDENW